ncbi:heparan-alpha-glucosaminide N-acetyltransferase domain-containing protein [Cereibacter azotoformans]|uniref:heparan-alpha-glucosaminide N-acetyltransferase domain-containing protein n=1 Tax=Cereibacter azotoformans TaxID=43057 RepID=UPI000C6D2D42|nr:OpgC domain-containing protein [Cereibacter azotoformans]
MPTKMSRSSTPRINGVDVTRSFAIMLVMLSHALIEFDVFSAFPGTATTLLRFLIQTAPVTFICLFGAMLEIVYAPRFVPGAEEAVTRRLWTRALQCYLLYALSVLALHVSGGSSPGYTIRCLLMLGVTPYTDILKFYALALLAAPLLLRVRLRYGMSPLLLFAVAVPAAYPLLARLPEPPLVFGYDYLLKPASFLYGGTSEAGGPSVLHGLALVAAGMILGRGVRLLLSAEGATRRDGRLIFGLMLGVAGTASALMWNWQAPFATLAALADMSLRNDNHPLYGTVGLAVTLIEVLLAVLLFDRLGRRWGSPLLFLGRTSLFTFAFGNILLYLAPERVPVIGGGLPLALVVFAIMMGQSWLFLRLMTPVAADASRIWRAVATRFQRLVRWMQRPVDGTVSRLVPSRG